MNTKQKKKISGSAHGFGGKKNMAVMARIITILLSFSVIYPLFFIATVSFKNNQEFFSNIWGMPKVFRWENYEYAWVKANISHYAMNSIIVAFSAVGISLLLSLFAGYALSKLYIPYAEWIVAALMALNFVPGVAVYIPLYMQMIKMGLSRTLLMLILPQAAWHLPLSIYILKKFLDSVPTELLESARVDGSGEIMTFIKIILPLITPAIASVIVFNFINIWGEYLWASIASSTTMAIQTLPVGLLNFHGDYGMEWGPFAAAIVIIVLPLICVFIYFQKYFIQGLTSGAVKG